MTGSLPRSPRPRRLLFVVNEWPFFRSHRLVLARGARQAGYDVHVAAPLSAEERAECEGWGLVAHPLPMNRFSASIGRELRALLALIALYRRLKPDIVHQITIKPVLYGSLAARLTRVPAVVNAVSGLGFIYIAEGRIAALRRRAAMLAYRIAFAHPRLRVIFQNDDDRDQFVRGGIVRERDTVLIGGSGVDLGVFTPRPEPAGVPVVMFPARMLWHKGLAEFVEAARLLRGRVAARFALVGGLDVNRSAVAEPTIRAWEGEGIVEWWGRRDDMAATLAEATIVCLPSYREGVPKVLLEAAAVGRAIVTTDVPGCRDVVRNATEGRLVPARDATRLADAIAELLADPAARATAVAALRRRAVEEFDVAGVLAQTLAIYESLTPD